MVRATTKSKSATAVMLPELTCCIFHNGMSILHDNASGILGEGATCARIPECPVIKEKKGYEGGGQAGVREGHQGTPCLRLRGIAINLVSFIVD